MYFNNVKNLAELKRQYRKLAFTLHPDRGGDAKAFSAMQIEYERLFAELENAKVNQTYQTRYSYNGQGNQNSDASHYQRYQKTSYSYNEQANQAGNANKEQAQSGQRRKQRNRNNYGHRDVDDGFKEIIEILIHLSGIKIELCGQWLWISGKTKENEDALMAAGCKRAVKKRKWYWRPPGSASRYRGKAYSMSYIRKKYGSVKINAEEEIMRYYF